MDKNEKDLDGVSEEEKNLEVESQQEVNDEELRAKVAEDLGIDPENEENQELLDKLVDREKSNHEKLSGAIKQKISWREKYQKASANPKDTPGKDNKSTKEQGGTESQDEVIRRVLREERDRETLESLDYPDDLKDEIKDFAKVKGIPIKEAVNLPYIQSRVEEIKKEERLKAATPTRSKGGTYKASVDPSKPLNPEDFDFDSEEGVKAWQEAKRARERYISENK